MGKKLCLFRVSQPGKRESVFYAVVVREGPPAIVQLSQKGFTWFFNNSEPEEIAPQEFVSKLKEFGEKSENRLNAIENFLSLKFNVVFPHVS